MFGDAVAKFLKWRQLSQQLPVFEFFSVVLSQGGRKTFHCRLGHAVDESLDAFLQRARDHGQTGQPGLSHFLYAFRQGNSEVKRDMDSAGAEVVRVMTIHGAKGLEAPIVYLPDMLNARMPSDSLVSTEEAVYWPAGKPENEYMAALKIEAKEMRDQEADRLLYVALTRARQALFISGWSQKISRVEKDSWYESASATIQCCKGAYALEDGTWRLVSGQPDASSKARPQAAGLAPPLPSWLEKVPDDEPIPARPLTPSDTGPRDATIPFGTASRKAAMLRGSFVHRLFEILPDLPASSRWAAASRIAAIMGMKEAGFDKPAAFTTEEIKALFEAVEQVMSLPELSSLFSRNALAEADISGLVGGQAVQGQIDRMVVLEDKVIIADFKTGLPPKELDDLAQIPPAYLRQMALYGALVSQIYPDREVECLLIWTQIMKVSSVPAQRRQEMLEQLAAVPDGT
jgi:ATP-dependent helicase/nuclease subunit A